MKRLKMIITFLILNGFLISYFPQGVTANWGKSGIFIKLTDNLKLAKSGKFEILKKTGNSSKLLGSVKAPQDKAEFINKLKYYSKYLPDFKLPQNKMINRLWNSFNKNNSIDSLYFWGTTPLVKLAVGVMFLDTAAIKGSSNSYVVRHIDKLGKTTNQFTVKNVKYIKKANIGKISFNNVELQNNYFLLTYSAKPKYPSAVQVYRREKISEPFEKIKQVVGFSNNNKKLYITIIDSTINIGSVYQYYITPVNRFNLEGKNSDTTLCAAYDFKKAFLPSDFKAESSDSLNGIRLTWSPIAFPYVNSIVIERSDIFDSLFTKIAQISKDNTEFIDYQIEPMKKYFYRMKLIGPLNEETHYSARIFGMYEDKSIPLPPFALMAKEINKGVELNWVSIEPFIKGFYVYRNNGINKKLQIVSNLIPAGDSLTVYQDTSLDLKAGYTYMYSVIAENTSHIQSPFSDTVFVRPKIKEKLLSPTNLQSTIETNGVQLYWDDMRKINETIIGYYVYRKELNSNKNFKPTKIDTLLFPESNNYFDKQIGKGNSFEYFVQSVGVNNSVSELSTGIIIKPEILKPVPPGNISVSSVNKGILIKWDKPLDKRISQFNLFRYQRGRKSIKIGKFAYLGKNEYLDVTVRKGKLYFYYMNSVTANGVESEMSKEVGTRY